MVGISGRLGSQPVDVLDGTFVESQFDGKFGEPGRLRVAEIHPDQRTLRTEVLGDVGQGKVLSLQYAV